MSVLIAFGAALLSMPVAGAFGRALRLADDPAGDPLKIHRRPVSVLGGVAVLVPALLAARPSAVTFAAVGIVLVTGLLDDVRSLSPLLQAGAQLAAGIALAAGGERLAALAVLLVFACTNGVNFLDGQDGLAAGLAAIAAVTLAGLGAGSLGYTLAAALAAFLLWNAAGNQLFLGNGGAYGAGVVLAVLAVELVQRSGWHGVCACALALGVFACELVHTVWRRAGSDPLTAGDRSHSYDLLAAELGSRFLSTLCLWAFGGVSAGLAVVAYLLPLSASVALTVGTFTCAALAVYRPAQHLRRARSYVG